VDSASSAAIPKNRPEAPLAAESPPLPDWVPVGAGAEGRVVTVAGRDSPASPAVANAKREAKLAVVKLNSAATAAVRPVASKEDPSGAGATGCATGATAITSGAAGTVGVATARASGAGAVAAGAVGVATVASGPAAGVRGAAAGADGAAGAVRTGAVTVPTGRRGVVAAMP
jgi:hypothetical protein